MTRIIIDVDQLKPGSLLGEDVINAQGIVLLKKGLQLEEKHTRILKRWGIQKISIAESALAGKDPKVIEQFFDKRKVEIDSEMNNRFKAVEAYPLMMEIKQVVWDVRLEQLKKQVAGEEG